jgi:GH15 family glucan-1,4-alpha-glucosidase
VSIRIEGYALLGDGETAALLSRDGSIDWLCWPRFDDAACFAALLGTPEHGHCIIAPASPVTQCSRHNQDDTLIMETAFETAGGTVRTIDFMPMRCRLRLRFDYGALPPWSQGNGREMVAKVGPDLAVLRAPIDLTVGSDETCASFDVQAGERLAFVLSYGASHEASPPPVDAEAALIATQSFWRGWIGQFNTTAH